MAARPGRAQTTQSGCGVFSGGASPVLLIQPPQTGTGTGTSTDVLCFLLPHAEVGCLSRAGVVRAQAEATVLFLCS